MRNRVILWGVLFAVGLLMILCRMEISRFISDEVALLVAGCVLGIVAGAGLLMELYRKSR